MKKYSLHKKMYDWNIKSMKIFETVKTQEITIIMTKYVYTYTCIYKK